MTEGNKDALKGTAEDSSLDELKDADLDNVTGGAIGRDRRGAGASNPTPVDRD